MPITDVLVVAAKARPVDWRPPVLVEHRVDVHVRVRDQKESELDCILGALMVLGRETAVTRYRTSSRFSTRLSSISPSTTARRSWIQQHQFHPSLYLSNFGGKYFLAALRDRRQNGRGGGKKRS